MNENDISLALWSRIEQKLKELIEPVIGRHDHLETEIERLKQCHEDCRKQVEPLIETWLAGKRQISRWIERGASIFILGGLLYFARIFLRPEVLEAIKNLK